MEDRRRCISAYHSERGRGPQPVRRGSIRLKGAVYSVAVPRITFEPSGIHIDCNVGETVFAAARRANLAIPTACVGKGTCGLCRVKIIDGAASLPPINPVEVKHLGNTYFITKLRLSCQCVVSGDVTVKIPDAAGKK